MFQKITNYSRNFNNFPLNLLPLYTSNYERNFVGSCKLASGKYYLLAIFYVPIPNKFIYPISISL